MRNAVRDQVEALVLIDQRAQSVGHDVLKLGDGHADRCAIDRQLPLPASVLAN